MYFEIQADDLQRAIAFYQGSFGWRFTRAEGLPIEYWRIETGGPRGPAGPQKVSIGPRDDFKWNLFRTYRGTFTDIRAASELLGIHLGYHLQNALVTLRLTLWQ